ncbi:MAG: rhodanese-like domain-containing protein [Fimbriiglobus sp.]
MRPVLLSTVAMILFVGLTLAAEHTKDTPEEVKKSIADKKAVILDVRELKEWNDGHLQDAKLLELSKIQKGVPKDDLEKLMPKGKVVYVHCKSGGRCLIAADELKKLGYEVRALKEGYSDLIKAGFEKAK